MSITLVQTTTKSYSAGGSALAYGSNNTGGNFLTCACDECSSSSYITDTKGNTWILALLDTSGNGQAIFCASNCAAGANTVTVHGASAPSMCIQEWTNLSYVDAIGATGNGTGAGASWTS